MLTRTTTTYSARQARGLLSEYSGTTVTVLDHDDLLALRIALRDCLLQHHADADDAEHVATRIGYGEKCYPFPAGPSGENTARALAQTHRTTAARMEHLLDLLDTVTNSVWLLGQISQIGVAP